MAPFQRRRTEASAGFALDGAAPLRPHAGLLRRERRDLRKAHADLIGQLGGLMVEMYRRNEYRDDLLAQACAQVIAIDDRVAEIDALLQSRRRGPACTCGTPLLSGARFCPNCGRGLTGAPALPQHPRPREG